MRVVYLYTGDNGDNPDWVGTWSPADLATNAFALSMGEQGFFYMWKRLVKQGFLDEVLIVIKMTTGMGNIQYCDGVRGLVVPNFRALDEFLQDGDIIFVRDGFRWLEQLRELKQRGHPLVFYAANSARAKWDIWDVICEDCNDRILAGPWTDHHGSIHMPFYKPTNPMLFNPINGMSGRYDICIGASHIHDKKGQHRVIDALIQYKKRYGVCPKCVLPGRFYHAVHTNQILPKIAEHELDVDLPGMVSKRKMKDIYNQSRLFVAPGGSGQNDRNVLEAMRCGCPVLFAYRGHRPPWLYAEDSPAIECNSIDDPWQLAYWLHQVQGGGRKQSRTEDNARQATWDWHERHNGMENVVLPAMKLILERATK